MPDPTLLHAVDRVRPLAVGMGWVATLLLAVNAARLLLRARQSRWHATSLALTQGVVATAGYLLAASVAGGWWGGTPPDALGRVALMAAPGLLSAALAGVDAAHGAARVARAPAPPTV